MSPGQEELFDVRQRTLQPSLHVEPNAQHWLDWHWLLVLKEDVVLDVVFVAISLLFFALSVGYVALCDRLMNKR
jgi:hypothetical protein